ncbi:MAG TPA: methylated-DNA--[protein]-cysteine S-methyltransferase [Verrucomicrobiae bacterium]|nr:methylated-DNA--[protein]-cysteine S-methyltransferase [Verrucomicrobiae bacterium]
MDNLVRDPVIVPTKLGAFRVQFSFRGLTRLEFCKDGGVLHISKQLAETLPYDLTRKLQQYAEGKSVRWEIPLDLSSGTIFQRQVWHALTKIPYGETRSYGWIAKQIGKPKASRAVGAACGANPVPVIVPCHRVIAGDGSLGGFGGGLPMKRRLLSLERDH